MSIGVPGLFWEEFFKEEMPKMSGHKLSKLFT